MGNEIEKVLVHRCTLLSHGEIPALHNIYQFLELKKVFSSSEESSPTLNRSKNSLDQL